MSDRKRFGFTRPKTVVVTPDSKRVKTSGLKPGPGVSSSGTKPPAVPSPSHPSASLKGKETATEDPHRQRVPKTAPRAQESSPQDSDAALASLLTDLPPWYGGIFEAVATQFGREEWTSLQDLTAADQLKSAVQHMVLVIPYFLNLPAHFPLP